MLENAKWIWADIPFEVNQYVSFESVFSLDDVRGVRAEISVSGEYALYINDAFAGFGQFGDWPNKKTCNVHDISDFCHCGENRFELRAWHMGIDSMVSVAGEGKACFRVFKGEKNLVSSGEHILCCADNRYMHGEGVHLITGQLGFSFEYDAAAPMGELRPAKLCKEPQICVPRPVPLLKTDDLVAGKTCFQGYFVDEYPIQERPAVRMMRSALSFATKEDMMAEDGAYTSDRGDGICLIFDLEKERAGYFSMDIDLDADADILIGWGEHLKDLRVRTAIDGRNFCAVYHGIKGRYCFMHPFRRMGCRYIQLHVYARRVKVHHVGLIPVRYPFAWRNVISLADNMHRRICETAVETLELCVHDHYEDCPWREQALYAMDSRIQILCGYCAFGETKMPRASLELLAGGLREDGLLEICAPAKAPITIPCFSLAFIVELWEYVLYTGDRDVNALTDTALTILNAFENRKDREGRLLRLREKKYWNFYEWQPDLDGAGPGRKFDYELDLPDGLLTAWYIVALDSCEKLLMAIGREAEAFDVHAKLVSARNAFESFWDEEKRLYAAVIEEGRREVWSELMQALAIIGGACPGERAAYLRKRLRDRGGMIPVTLNDALLRYQALMQDEEKYADFVFEDIARIWGNMIAKGAKSFWETELGEADFHNAGSLCHGWSAVPVYFYYAYGMGMRPEYPGKMKKYPVYQKVLGKVTVRN